MRLTPLDIRKQEFKRAMRGLDADEVHAFLSTVADEYESILNDNKALRERLLELDDKVQEYRNMEKTLRDTLLTAERVTVEAKDNARREADLIIKQAELEADRGVRNIKDNAMALRQEIQVLKRQREGYLSRMKMLVETHLNFVENATSDFEDEEKRLAQEYRDSMGSSATDRTLWEPDHAAARASASVRPLTPAPDTTTPAAETAPAPRPDTTPDRGRDTHVSSEALPPTPVTPTPVTPTPVSPPPATDHSSTDGDSATDRLNALLDKVMSKSADSDTQGTTHATPQMDVTIDTSPSPVVAMPQPAGARPVDTPLPPGPVTATEVARPETATEPTPVVPAAPVAQSTTAPAAAPATSVGVETPTAPATDTDAEDESGQWSLDRLKRDILSRGSNEND